MSRDGRCTVRATLASRALLVLAAAAASGAPLAVAQSDNDAALRAVRTEIKALQARLAREGSERDANARALRAIELEIAAGTRKLQELRTQLRAQQARQRSLGAETLRAGERLAAERRALAQQVRLNYLLGREEMFKLLLSQESPASLGRMLVYYDYFNRARSERIAAVSGELAELGALRAEGERVERELGAIETAQANEVAARGRAREERRALLATLDAGIADANARILALKADERRLAELVEQLGELLSGLPLDAEQPFARTKGHLSWPVQGRLAGEFGQPRGGGPVKWNGVLLEANAGTPVRAIYRGRVAFADWLPGLGLLIIVDHGAGYMSLYGHNEALLKESGDWVEPGDAIAQVGDTGGQARPSLYFEIRENGEPVNPHQWIAARPAVR